MDTRSLCAPSDAFSCFACCPPIRPAHYDHMDFAGSLRRELRDNRRRFLAQGPGYRPIVGYSCWALGFLEPEGRRIGCLLHPSQNKGVDLRFLVDYGKKCMRESCPAARMFERIPRDCQDFWLTLVEGFDSFRFSSYGANPLFHLLLWGPQVLAHLHGKALDLGWSAANLVQRHSYLMSSKWNPLAHRFLFRLTLESITPNGHTCQVLESLCLKLRERIHGHPAAKVDLSENGAAVFTHLLPFERDFLDFIRLDLGYVKITHETALELEHAVTQLSELLFEL
ncbi:MAG: hypothetical protein GX422_18390 [Deltaproteobacteria bacterium]|nr:hypothetical protein [Deltaproteobacteria bacterium]